MLMNIQYWNTCLTPWRIPIGPQGMICDQALETVNIKCSANILKQIV